MFFLSVGHSGEPCKTAEPVEILFKLWTRVGPRNHILRWGPDPSGEGAILGDMSRPIVKYMDTLQRAAEKRLTQSAWR